MFWPKDWLPNEAGFENVRIHSYGHNPDWKSEKQGHLTAHNLGQALLADLHNSPCMKKRGEVGATVPILSDGADLTRHRLCLSPTAQVA